MQIPFRIYQALMGLGMVLSELSHKSQKIRIN